MVFNRIWKDSVWSAVIADGIVAVIAYLYGYWSQIWQSLNDIPSLLSTLLRIPVWAVLLAVPTLLLSMPFIAYLKAFKDPRFASYTSEAIFDVNWSWRWLYSRLYNSHYQIKDLTPCCPFCSAALKINGYGGALIRRINENCSWQWQRQSPHGSLIGRSSELDSKVRDEIDRHIHAGERG